MVVALGNRVYLINRHARVPSLEHNHDDRLMELMLHVINVRRRNALYSYVTNERYILARVWSSLKHEKLLLIVNLSYNL